jgi:hypothetical protein
MTQQHPITPSDELIGEWIDTDEGGPNVISRIATRAAQWGADQELEALLVWLRVKGFDNLASDLLAARRPKPPSLKEQALALINHDPANQPFLSDKGIDTIRRALEQLPDNE